jgi:hypothetical protein
MLNVIMLNGIKLNVIMLNVIMLNIIMINVIMLNGIVLNVVMLSVVAPICSHLFHFLPAIKCTRTQLNNMGVLIYADMGLKLLGL